MTFVEPDSWLLMAIAFYPAFVLAVFWHEAGHSLAAWLMGQRVLAWGIGLSHPWLRFRWGKSIFYVGRPLHGGLSLVLPEIIKRSLRRQFVFIAGGPLATIVGLLVGSALYMWGTPSGLLLAWIVASAIIVLSTCIPYRVQHGETNLASDAWQLIDNLMKLRMSRVRPMGTTLTTVLAASDLLRNIGSADGADYYRLLGGLVQCDLADLDGARAAIDVGRTISAADIPEARWLLLLLESACLVATESPQAEEYLAAAKLEARNLPELQYLIAMVEFRSRLARGERIVDDLHVLIKQAERDGRRDRLCSLELLAFEADPPADATAACRQAIARHRHYVGDTQLARLLAFTTELLAARGQFPAARALFQEAQLALLQAAQSIQPAERRARYLSDASLPLQRAALINREDLPLFLSEVLPAKVVRGVFGRMTINLGYLSLGLAIVARWGVLMRSTPIPLNAAMIVCLFVALCWFGSLAATIASLLRSERRYAQVLVGMVLATAGLVLAAQLLPDATKGDPKNLRNYPPHSAGPIPASS